ncbi:MAG: serine/threonine protein kinase/formylglycine-generating enzyme required for sulfatase activity [Planctomycetota bacterium]|jgi:serine/threonine protein kinase/formylglycine-generating enzyme required for sulfatase activity
MQPPSHQPDQGAGDDIRPPAAPEPDSSEPAESASERAEALFALFIEQHEHAGPGNYEDWAQGFGQLRPELDALWKRWGRLRTILDGIGMHKTIDAPVRARDREERQIAGKLISQFAKPRPGAPRYKRRGELGRGGMAIVYRAFDTDLDRELAMKVLRGPSTTSAGAGKEDSSKTPSGRALARFLEEAQITAKLDHPGITSIHELGIDEEGRAYFTMQLVRGVRLDQLIENKKTSSVGWSEPKMLETLLKVCDAVSYAHAKGVVHRDLKPANIMVGRFGETYVIDWGLARVIDRETSDHGTKMIHTYRSRVADEDPYSPLMTVDGDIIGTPAYMSPEQASGSSHSISATSDVYAIGAVLYELLSGQAPYLDGDSALTSKTLLERIIKEPPRDLARVAASSAPELRGICSKAMKRDPKSRYPNVRAMASDLRAYIAGRPVNAYQQSWYTKGMRWMRRNAVPVAFVSVIVAALSLGYWREMQRKDELLKLAEVGRLRDIQLRADQLWPPLPELVPQLKILLDEAHALSQRIGTYASTLSALRARSLPHDEEAARLDREQHPSFAELTGLEAQLLVLEAGLDGLAEQANVRGDHSGAPAERLSRLRLKIAELQETTSERVSFRFEDQLDQLTHDTLADLLREREIFMNSDPHSGVIASLEDRLERARSIKEKSIGLYAYAWKRTITGIRTSPIYAGLEVTPQLGLVPLGMNPSSGLWEFAHLFSGEVPSRASDGRLLIRASSAIVLILLPRVRTQIGATEGNEPLHLSERGGQEFELEPYFLSKYELTQAQWSRLTGTEPSRYAINYEVHGQRVTGRHPAENIRWHDAQRTLRRWDLTLPTEAQWECAARAGGLQLRWTGQELSDMSGKENVADRTSASVSVHLENEQGNLPSDDGWILHAPVGSLLANPWGFHDTLGNVAEWCLDVFMVSHDWPMRAGDGLRLHPEPSQERVTRGGSFYTYGSTTRVTYRQARHTQKPSATIGVRPARHLR